MTTQQETASRWMNNAPPPAEVRVHRAYANNLQNVDVVVPRGKLVGITGVSGSGKSSLAFDVLYAEGQRRYLETLAVGMRRLLPHLPRPQVDSVTGLPPTLCVRQGGQRHSRRSTLGSATEIADSLQVLFARAGQAHCPTCNRPIQQHTPAQIADEVLRLPERTKLLLLTPMVPVDRTPDETESPAPSFWDRVRQAGFVRVRNGEDIVDVADVNEADVQVQDALAVVDRLVIKPGLRARLEESLALALRHGAGRCVVSHQADETWCDREYSTKYACTACDQEFPPLTPQSFNPNSPRGACGRCDGMGLIDIEETGGPSKSAATQLCPECAGVRLQPLARAVRFCGRSWQEMTQAHTLAGLLITLQSWRQDTDCAHPERTESAGKRSEIPDDPAVSVVMTRCLDEVIPRLKALCDLGLGYLNLARETDTLSGGELQRTRLANHVRAGLRGVCHILDEPTSGLHPQDTDKLLAILQKLRDAGNTVLVVEHDPRVLRAVDWLLELGPGAGAEGGCVTAVGTPADLQQNPASISGPFLKEHRCEYAAAVTFPPTSEWLTLRGACRHHLQNVTLQVPLQRMTVVTGVSGAGKSTLIAESLVPALRRWHSERDRRTPAADDAALLRDTRLVLENHEEIARLIVVDQSPIGQSRQSCPATVTGLWDEIRKLLAKTREARVRGFSAARFSFNHKQGRCPECHGNGTIQVDLNFLPDAELPCPACAGQRFNPLTLAVQFGGRTAGELLQLSFEEAREVFAGFATIRQVTETFCDVGLGYLQLGQTAASLSGGEAQRVKLAAELCQNQTPHTLFVLDEPTAGLHPLDVARLIDLLRRFTADGHTVLVVEHNLQLIAQADWAIDMGPGAGADGGQITAAATPRQLALGFETPTARALAAVTAIDSR